MRGQAAAGIAFARRRWDWLVVAVATLGNAAMPLISPDTDAWYHLNVGRWIVAHGSLPTTAYFSYLQPPRAWSNFSWLFEVCAFAVYSLAGPLGLILCRAALYGATLTLVRGVLSPKDAASWTRRAIFAIFAVFLWHRFLMVRPHVASYLLIAGYLFVVEHRPRFGWLFLPAGVLWGNLHGGYYPVAIMFAGVCAVDAVWTRAKPEARERRRLALWAVAGAAGMFLTPLGAALAKVPFVSLDYAKHQLFEIQPFDWWSLFSIRINRGLPDADACFALVVWAGIAALVLAAYRRRLQPRQLLLFAGGLALVARSGRFEYECALLALPLLGACDFFDEKSTASPARAWAALPALLAPLILVVYSLSLRPRWPVSWENLPIGTAAYLNASDLSGKVLAEPGASGYLEWALAPRFKIATDLRMPQPFNNEDYYRSAYALFDRSLLKSVVEVDHPDFIAGPIWRQDFHATIAAFPQYVPVFFDDQTALYLDSAAHPREAARDRLPIDPFNLPAPSVRPGAGDGACGAPPYLQKMIGLSPQTLATRLYLVRWCLAAGDAARAIIHVGRAIEEHPDRPEGYLFAGRALRLVRDHDDSISLLKKGLRRADDEHARLIRRELSENYRAVGDLGAAADYGWRADPELPPGAFR